jgi:hypothetical protein
MGVDDKACGSPPTNGARTQDSSQGLDFLLEDSGDFVAYGNDTPLTIGEFYNCMMQIYGTLNASFPKFTVEMKYAIVSARGGMKLKGDRNTLGGLAGIMKVAAYETSPLSLQSSAEFTVVGLSDTMRMSYAEREPGGDLRKLATWAMRTAVRAVTLNQMRLEPTRHGELSLSYHFRVPKSIGPEDAEQLAHAICFFPQYVCGTEMAVASAESMAELQAPATPEALPPGQKL